MASLPSWIRATRATAVQVPAGATLNATAGQHWTLPTAGRGSLRINATGTPTEPVFLSGGLINDTLEIKGTYICIDEITGVGANLWILGDSDQVVVKDSKFSNRSGSCVQLDPAGNQPGAWVRNTWLSGCEIVDNGSIPYNVPGGDPDNHGVVIQERVENVYIMGCEVARNAGNAIQVNGGSLGQTHTRNIYIVGNNLHDNRQSAIGIKQCSEVYIIGNDMYRSLFAFSDYGAAVTMNYNPEGVYIIGNFIDRCITGVRDTGGARTIDLIGNRFTNITGGVFQPNGQALLARPILLPNVVLGRLLGNIYGTGADPAGVLVSGTYIRVGEVIPDVPA